MPFVPFPPLFLPILTIVCLFLPLDLLYLDGHLVIELIPPRLKQGGLIANLQGKKWRRECTPSVILLAVTEMGLVMPCCSLPSPFPLLDDQKKCIIAFVLFPAIFAEETGGKIFVRHWTLWDRGRGDTIQLCKSSSSSSTSADSQTAGSVEDWPTCVAA